ncbi:MAG: hypothetical protein JWQ72_2988 [Polaromonas sp.]|nr:hypothetical protein [Polaromonas sp.]
MNESDKDATEAEEKLEALHERVNQMLDLPLPEEGEAWSLRLDTSPANIPPGHDASGAALPPETPA